MAAMGFVHASRLPEIVPVQSNNLVVRTYLVRTVFFSLIRTQPLQREARYNSINSRY